MDLNDDCKNNSINFDEDYMEEEVKIEKGGSDEFEMEDNFEEGEGELNNVDEMDENDEEPDFLDNSGKIWDFACKIQDERHLKKWCRKMGAIIVSKDEKLTRQYECSIEECPFQVTFLKSCSIVYTRNEHNHGEENEENIQKKEQKAENHELDYIDYHGKHWPFRARLGKNCSQVIFREEFGFTQIQKNKTYLYLHCGKSRPAVSGKCRFVGIYLEENGCLYTRGKHEHTKKGKIPQSIGDDYEDHYGQIWKFSEEVGENIQTEIFRTKFGLTIHNSYQLKLILRCPKIGIDGGKCLFRGIYIKENGCLYVRGKHEHKY